MKFTVTEAGYQLTRNRGRSIIMLCVSLLLCGCIAFYLGSITTSERALRNINESNPAVVNICNPTGDSMENLVINTIHTDLLQAGWEMKDVRLTSQAAGAFSKEAREQDPKGFSGGDTKILGINCVEAMGTPDQRYITYMDGYDGSCFSGSEPLCIISEDYAGENNISPGDELSMPMYLCKYRSDRRPVYYPIFDSDTWGGDEFETPPDWTLKVVGTFSHKLGAYHQADVYLPVQWLRDTMDSQDLPFNDFRYSRLGKFSYNTFQCSPVDSMKLNEMKLKFLDMGFGIPFYMPISGQSDFVDFSAGRSIWMDDEDFIKTAEKLAGTVRMYKAFMAPFFLVVVLLVTLAVLLVLRGARRDMALALSIGREKRDIAFVHLLSSLSAQGLGCLIALPGVLLLARVDILTALIICGAFLLCAVIGDIMGLWGLLRFDALELLTKTD